MLRTTSARSARARIAVLAVTTLVTTGFASVEAATSASAAPASRGSIVSDDPNNRTPHVLDGRVLSIAQDGDSVVLGGTFTSAANDVRNDPASTAYPRANLVAFDAQTGVISQTFAPDTNGTVNVVIPAGDGQTVYVGGSFTQIAGQAVKNLARIRVSDGSLVTSFNGGSPAGQVKDLRLSGGRLWVAGSFTHIAGKQQLGLATLNPTTGAFDQFARPLIAGQHNGGFTTVAKIDVDPASTRLIAIGNFDTLNAVQNHQFFMLDISGATAVPSALRTSFYTTACSRSFDSYMRDLDFSPDGSFFVISTTGAYGGADKSCDSTARFEAGASGTDVQPSWIDNTGGDTTYAVEITDAVVYTGGHARWQNNPFAGDRPGTGAVSRPGIAALNPENGLPYQWNPTRDRGVGVFDLLATPQGLWIGSDTERIGASEYHARIAMFPAEGGAAIPATRTPELPNSLYSVNTLGAIAKRSATTTGFTPAQSTTLGGTAWTSNRGAFMLNGQLYTGSSTGEFTRRTFDGTTMGAPVQVNLGDQLTAMTDWDGDVARITGLFYDNGRVYFTRSDANALYYRYLNVESDLVGARRYQVTSFTGMDLRLVRGMYLAGDKVYIGDSSGNLSSWNWVRTNQAGAPVNGTKVVVSGPAKDGVNWSSTRSLFLYQDADGNGDVFPPTAVAATQCTDVTCTFDGSGSTAPGSSIASYHWDFGDGTSADGAQVQHTYAASGDYVVTLTVTTARGASAVATKSLNVVRVNQVPVSSFTAQCAELSCTLDSSGSSDPDGTVAATSWAFGDGTTSTEAVPVHAFADNGTYRVTLTVTDNQGGTATSAQDVTVRRATVDVVGAVATNANRTAHTTSLPAGVTAGDRLVAVLTLNSSTATFTAPDGWTNVSTVTADGLVTTTWTREAGASEPQSVRFTTSAAVKSDLTVAAYRSSTGHTVLGQAASFETPRQSTQFLSGPVTVARSGARVAHYWAVKSSVDLVLTAPGGTQGLASSVGAGSGRIVAALADSGSPRAGGDVVQATASSDVASSRGASLAIVIAPQ